MPFHCFHREKANLAVTLCNDKEEIMASAIFVDYPNWNVAKQDDWLSVFRELDSEIPCTVRKHVPTVEGRAHFHTAVISVSGERNSTLVQKAP